MNDKPLEVVCALFLNVKNEVLLCQRGAQMPNAGEWEFPGGKIEKDELPLLAVLRELQEELSFQFNAKAMQVLPFELVETFYKENIRRLINLQAVVIQVFNEEALRLELKEHSAFKWVSLDLFSADDVLEAYPMSIGDRDLGKQLAKVVREGKI